tara:strand:- start:641 stop:967 length:327 start_codon:yes stop_codon:yes gene_type:complete
MENTNFFEECVADVSEKIPNTWKDVSWGNDVCPSYSYNGWQIFIDHPDTDKRELNEDGREPVVPRFGVIVEANYGNQLNLDTPLLNSDDFQEVLEYVSTPAPVLNEGG